MKKILLSAIAGMVACAGSTAAMAQVQTLTFGGNLQYGSNNAGSPFGAANTSLAGKAYSVTLSYNPSLFVTSNANDYSFNSCGTAANTSCYFTFSAARPLTETVTVDGVTQTFVGTSGGFTLNAAGNDSISFSFQGASGLTLSGFFSDGNSLFPNQSNVNNPVFSNITNLALAAGASFNQSASSYNFGASPATLTASFTPSVSSAVPEPATWAMMIAGFGAVGGAMRRRRPARVSFA